MNPETNRQALRIFSAAGKAFQQGRYEEARKALRLFPGGVVTTDDDAAGVEVVIQCFGLPEEFRGEKDV